ncbi:MAG: tetratricopeptide repeat protein, partial [Verrucomicrobia bacterium]|nr:tetratricopeptide repeat protein [Verrucomicrobiota bacterium]
MSIRKLAAISLLVFSTIAATDVAPSNAELEAMYDKAFRAFDSADYTGALKELDAIDARKPDLAASQNLRGVIFMRQGAYDKAEAALSEALRLDPKFWNARFNLAEIPFLKKDWPEARKRFQELLSSNTSDLEGEATQLIQYKILLTYLLEQNDSMVASMLAKLQRSPDTPAAHYANAAIALQHKKTDEARNWMQAAEKNFSPQLNKLFAESLFEVGWIQQQPGQQRTALQLVTPEEHETGSKATAQSQLEQAQQAYEQRDFDKAATLAQQADTAQPNQPAILNLRGEILLEQGKYTEAEEFFTKALKIDSKFREAQFNLADVPFRQKDYGKARDRFQSLLKEIPGGDKNQASQLINFKIYMSYLLDGKESRAQKLMEQFQFSGDTPALYYAQAAWEFKHNNADKANDWIASARKIYPLSANAAYSTGFYNLGWLKGGATSASSPAPSAAGNAAAVASAQNESPAPSAIEPSPIPGAEAKGDENAFVSLQPNTTPAASPVSTAETKPSASPPVTAKEAEKTALAANAPASGSPAGQDFAPAPSAAVSPVVETSPVSAPASVQASAPPVSASAAAPPPVPSAARAVAQSTPATAPSASAAPKTQPAPSSAPAVASTEPVNLSETSTPPPVLSPARAPQFVQPSFGDRLDRLTDWRTLIWIPLLILGLALLAWVGIREFRGRVHPPHLGRRAAPAGGPNLHAPPEANKSATGKGAQRFSGGPRQVSVQLKASEPARPGVQVPAAEPAGEAPEAVSEAEAVSQPAIAEEQREDAGDLRDEELVGPVIEQDTAVPASTEAVGETSAAEPMLGSLQAGPQPLETAAALAANVTSRFAETDESVGPVMEQEPAAAGDIASETREEPAGVSDIPEQSSTAAAEPVD